MIYKGIETEDVWINGNWHTNFLMDGEIIKSIEWCGNFGETQIKKVIDRQIIPFI